MKNGIQKLLIALPILFFTSTLSAQDRIVDIYAPSKDEFLKKNTNIDSIQRKTFDSISLFLKSGVKESYNLSIPLERQKFIAQYGTPPNYVSFNNGRLSRRRNPSR